MDPWVAALRGWIAALRDEMRLSAGTLDKYENALIHYAPGSGSQDPSKVVAAGVRAYIGSLRELAPSTVRVRISAIKSFHQWLDSTAGCGDPTRRIRAPRVPERLPRALTERECIALIRSCDDSPLGVRDRAILECLYSTGCRAAELLTATLDGTHLDESCLHVIGKGNRERVCLLGPSATQAIAAWLIIRPAFDPVSDNLFLSRYGRRLSMMGLWKMVQMRAKLAGIERHIHPHMLRHSCASHMLRNGADLRSIQLVLGHRNLNSTQVYLAVDNERLREVHAASHPRGGASEPRLRTVGGAKVMDDKETEA